MRLLPRMGGGSAGPTPASASHAVKLLGHGLVASVCGPWGKITSRPQRLALPNPRNLGISHELQKNDPPLFSTHLARPGQNAPNRYAILITVHQSNHKRSCPNKGIANRPPRGQKTPNPEIFRKILPSAFADSEKKRVKRHSKFALQRLESSFHVHSAPKATAVAAKRPLCCNQRKSGSPANINRGAVQSRGRQPVVLARKRVHAGC